MRSGIVHWCESKMKYVFPDWLEALVLRIFENQIEILELFQLPVSRGRVGSHYKSLYVSSVELSREVQHTQRCRGEISIFIKNGI